jgi:hypothetical protein
VGGHGSGARGRCSGICVESCLAIDASRWSREGIIREDFVHSGGWGWTDPRTGEASDSIGYTVDTKEPWTGTVRLKYTWQSKEEIDYTVVLQKSRPNFGGVKWWFTCPLRCGRRVRKLFLPPGAKYFGCRNCYRLTYYSRNQDTHQRAWAPVRRIYKRLGSDECGTFIPPKPKGMWTRTYERLLAKAEAAHDYKDRMPSPAIYRFLQRFG